MAINRYLKVARPLAVALCVANGAHAQSTTQVYGVLDVWAGRSGISASEPGASAVNNGGLQTSYWGWGGSEDLGGAKVIYAVEGYLQVDTGAAGRTPTDAMFARNAFVGLQGRVGELKIGRVLNPLFVATAASNPFGGSIRLGPLLGQVWSPQMGRAVWGDTSWDNVVSYTTPKLAGFTFAALASLGETTFGTSTHNLGGTLCYVGGRTVVYASAQRVRIGPGLTTIDQSEQKTYFLGGSYDLGSFKVYGSYDTANGVMPYRKARTGQLGLSVPASSGVVMLSWARTDIATMEPGMLRRNTGAVGYDYPLSLRTELYAVAQVDHLTGASRAKTYATGVRLRF